MKHYRILNIVVLVVSLVMMGCSGKKRVDIDGFCVESYTPQYAHGFNIKSTPTGVSSLITVMNPWQGADSVTTTLLILRGDETAPEGFDGQILHGEAHRIVAMSSTHVAMLDEIGAINRVVGVSGIDFIANDYIQQHRDTIGDVGYDGNVNYELLMSLSPDMVLLYGLNGASSMEGKLREVGIPFMYVGDYLEQSPLGKAEWMVALSELTGRQETGMIEFKNISDRYNSLKAMVADSVTTAPTVMFNMPYGDAWYIPSADNYAVQLVKDAGGETVCKDVHGNSSQTIDMETAYMLTSKADVWINVGQATSLKDVERACPKFADTPCFAKGEVYNNNLRTTPTGGNDYYESAIVHPDWVLRDLVKILHPDLVEDDVFVYYQQLK